MEKAARQGLLRHSFANNLHARSVEMKSISTLLGYADAEILCNRSYISRD